MIIAHASDLHGSYKALGKVETPDLWLITGDFFPNYGRGRKTGGLIDAEFERSHQRRWWGYKGASIITRLRGKPVIWCPGNHDFVSLEVLLKRNYPALVHDVSKTPLEFMGQTWAGYREIPYLAGEWMGETQDFQEIVRTAMSANPTILVTHAPPGGILDDDKEGEYGHGCGVTAQTSALAYQEHRVTHHFFGHIHAQGGKTHEEMGVKFVNSATCIQIIEI